MTVMQFRQVRVIMCEGKVPMWVCVWFLKNSLSVMVMIVMFFVKVDVVVFDFLMLVRMSMVRAKE